MSALQRVEFVANLAVFLDVQLVGYRILVLAFMPGSLPPEVIVQVYGLLII